VDTLNGNSNISTNALEGLKVVDIIERIYQSGNRNIKESSVAKGNPTLS
jgi:UDP-N-acetyl-2-amino-2-deoxyglucuronate dehydrogenase